MLKNLKISVSNYELFDLVAIRQHWHAVKYGTDSGYSILRIPYSYPEISALEQLGYEPFRTQIEQSEPATVVCVRYYRILPAHTTLWLLKTGQTICVE